MQKILDEMQKILCEQAVLSEGQFLLNIVVCKA
jgi:hypothetical protein